MRSNNNKATDTLKTELFHSTLTKIAHFERDNLREVGRHDVILTNEPNFQGENSVKLNPEFLRALSTTSITKKQ